MEQNIRKKREDSKFHNLLLPSGAKRDPKKRRKVNHACVYCRRSHMTCDLERPCTRCIKRRIGHLCHDEPREIDSAAKKTKHSHNPSTIEGNEPCGEHIQRNSNNGMSTSFQTPQEYPQDSLTIESSALPQASLQITHPPPTVGVSINATNDAGNQFLEYFNDWTQSQSNQFHEMHNYHPLYMFNAPEVTTECNLLNDFLNSSLRDDGTIFAGETTNTYNNQVGGVLASGLRNHIGQADPHTLAPLTSGSLISSPSSAVPNDKTREYYLQAADPTGNDAPEERMQRLFQAKYDAGLLKPFNYVKGYARLSAYMESHLQPAQKLKILRQIEQFQPKFRENVQTLTDIELIYVEMWFERSLMVYDRVFASMAIPACCWRRTGEIFRGNKEMAELIQVPTENLRDGKIALHDIFAEESLVNYWEKFGAIAFNQGKKALLMSCFLKSPNEKLKGSSIRCCFSFNIKRDDYEIPSLIIGNFLPQDPSKH